MKNASHILASLRQKPTFSKLARQECIHRIRGLFPPRLQQMIRYGYLREGILYFVLDHPGAKQEFDNIIATIKEPLRRYAPEECAEAAPKDIRAFVKYAPRNTPQDAYARHTVFTYRERALGRFNTFDADPKLHAIFERIRRHIHARTDP